MLSGLFKSFVVGLIFFSSCLGLVWLCFNQTTIAATIAFVIASVVVGNFILKIKDHW